MQTQKPAFHNDPHGELMKLSFESGSFGISEILKEIPAHVPMVASMFLIVLLILCTKMKTFI